MLAPGLRPLAGLQEAPVEVRGHGSRPVDVHLALLLLLLLLLRNPPREPAQDDAPDEACRADVGHLPRLVHPEELSHLHGQPIGDVAPKERLVEVPRPLQVLLQGQAPQRTGEREEEGDVDQRDRAELAQASLGRRHQPELRGARILRDRYGVVEGQEPPMLEGPRVHGPEDGQAHAALRVEADVLSPRLGHLRYGVSQRHHEGRGQHLGGHRVAPESFRVRVHRVLDYLLDLRAHHGAGRARPLEGGSTRRVPQPEVRAREGGRSALRQGTKRCADSCKRSQGHKGPAVQDGPAIAEARARWGAASAGRRKPSQPTAGSHWAGSGAGGLRRWPAGPEGEIAGGEPSKKKTGRRS
mmetsp:Transcript_136703/g.424691  ORF Transcript_136703/g.424691 Transcript_136703/m.424691 type:complete len:355 (+) Transcript_136703:155-1219(+)